MSNPNLGPNAFPAAVPTPSKPKTVIRTVRNFGAKIGRVEAEEDIDDAGRVLRTRYVLVWPNGVIRPLSATNDDAAIAEGAKVLGVSAALGAEGESEASDPEAAEGEDEDGSDGQPPPVGSAADPKRSGSSWKKK